MKYAFKPFRLVRPRIALSRSTHRFISRRPIKVCSLVLSGLTHSVPVRGVVRAANMGYMDLDVSCMAIIV